MRRWPTCYQTAQAFAQNMSSSTDARQHCINAEDSVGSKTSALALRQFSEGDKVTGVTPRKGHSLGLASLVIWLWLRKQFCSFILGLPSERISPFPHSPMLCGFFLHIAVSLRAFTQSEDSKGSTALLLAWSFLPTSERSTATKPLLGEARRARFATGCYVFSESPGRAPGFRS